MTLEVSKKINKLLGKKLHGLCVFVFVCVCVCVHMHTYTHICTLVLGVGLLKMICRGRTLVLLKDG